MSDEAGTAELLLSEALELQARWAAETGVDEELRGSEERFRSLVDCAPDALVVVDRLGRITLVNTQAETLFCYGRDELLGAPLERLVPERFREEHARHCAEYVARPTPRAMGERLGLYARHKDGHEFPVDIALNTVGTGEQLRVISIVRDMTELRHLIQERDALIARLQCALATVKRLSGLIPICAWCKRIREDAGYWTQIEQYIREHSEADFTHGLCPECAGQLLQ